MYTCDMYVYGIFADSAAAMETSASKRFKADSPSVDISDIDKECSSVNVNGVVVKLSPVKVSQSSGSHYFEGNLSDGKVSRRFVSFETRLRSAFEKNMDDGNCVTLKNCQVKRSTFSKREGNLEILLGSTSNVETNDDKTFSVDVSQIEAAELIEITEVDKISVNEKVTVQGKVVKLEETVTVRKSVSGSLQKRDCIVSDGSAAIRLVLWEKDVDRVCEGKSFQLNNVTVRQWQGIKYQSVSPED